MSDRFRFRATFPVSYYDENGNDKDIKLTVYDVAVYSGGEIGFTAQQIETIINALELPEIEQDTMWQFINDNYATSSYEWFVCDNAIIEQCTGLKDKNGNLIYEGDIIHDVDKEADIDDVSQIVWNQDTCHFMQLDLPDTKLNRHCLICEADSPYIKIIGNIHKQPEQKD